MGSWMFPGARANAFWVALWLGTLACGVLLVASQDDSTKMIDIAEVTALLSFKNGLDDPDGNLGSWTEDTNPCESWKGVVCDQDLPQDVDQSVRHVTILNLLNLNLGGQVNASIGDLRALTILDLMWNDLSGTIPASIGQLQNLKLLLLSGNRFSGSVPSEIGNLGNLQRLQIDQNGFSGSIPSTFANLLSLMHLHLNNNTLTGTIPSGLGRLTDLLHVLVDTNRLTGALPSDLGSAPSVTIIQLDNNQFSGIPTAYTQIPTLMKLSVRNCSLGGPLPSFSRSTSLAVLDLSHNNFTGSLSDLALPANITALALSDNSIQGPVPASVGNLQNLSFLALSNNFLSGEIATNLGLGYSFSEGSGRAILDFQNNSLKLDSSSPLTRLSSSQSGSDRQVPVQVWLNGNDDCFPNNVNPLCVPNSADSYLQLDVPTYGDDTRCPRALNKCPSPQELRPPSSNFPGSCSCATPIIVYLRLKSPPFAIFDVYQTAFEDTIASQLQMSNDQIKVNSTEYELGPRIQLVLLIFPAGSQKSFNQTESDRISKRFYEFILDGDDATFGPHEIISVSSPTPPSSSGSSKISVGAIVGIVVGAILVSAIVSALLVCCCLKRRGSYRRVFGKSKRATPINVPGVRSFSFAEMVRATDNFRDENLLGRGGYGNVYFGVLEDGQRVAVKRAEEGSLQGSQEFENEIQLLSRVHHKNLVDLVGYCNDDGEHINGEQMLIYEFVPNGNLQQHLSPKAHYAMDIKTRIRIALSAARGIQYLHTQADPPIFHRDIKSPNILLDEKYNAKVSDFGLSKLALADANLEGVHTGHITTVVKGTPGYLDPEYFLTNQLTDRSDVYSFGVVLLELITGLPPIVNGKNLTREVNAAFREGDAKRIVDPRMGSYSMDTIEPMLKVGLNCINSETSRRPSMTDVLHELEEIWREAPWSDVASQSHMEDDSRELGKWKGEGSGQQWGPYSGSSNNPSRTGLYNRGESELTSQTNVCILPR